ncbi:MAG: hypothetical protein WKF73_03055 [Nocardioidaceae bacterium]
MSQAVVMGALWAVGLAFPLAAACALVYQFPVPLVGYRSGPSAIPGALAAVMFYGLWGVSRRCWRAGRRPARRHTRWANPTPRRVRQLVPALGGLVAALGIGLLAILDKLIGPW